MREISVTELQLLSCLGVEPELSDPTVASWYYNTATYRVQLDRCDVVLVLQPASRDLQLTINVNGQRSFELTAMTVHDVRVIDEQGVDALEIVLDARSQLILQLRPRLEIIQQFQ